MNNSSISTWIIILGLLLYLAWTLTQWHQDKMFKEVVGVDRPRKMSIKRVQQVVGVGYVDIRIPRWRYARRDGCRDGRRAHNEVVRSPSTIRFDSYLITSRDFIMVYKTTLLLRRVQGYAIKLADVELKKKSAVELRYRQSQVTGSEGVYAAYKNNPRGFEFFCAELLEGMEEGATAVVTSAGSDGGIDIVVTTPHEKWVVECKCYDPSRSVGRPIVQKLVGANAHFGADQMAVMTTGFFTKSAIEYAESLGVVLLDGVDLAELSDHESNDAPLDASLDLDDFSRLLPADMSMVMARG